MITPIASFPVFIVEDLSTAKAFYVEHFSFNPAFENEWYLHLVSESGIQIGFMLPMQPSQPPCFQSPHNTAGVIFSLEVQDADAAHAYAQEQSMDITLSLRSEEWGQRHFVVVDPNGVHVDVVQGIDPTAEYAEGYTDA